MAVGPTAPPGMVQRLAFGGAASPGLLICLGLALLVRLPGLGGWPLWSDETATAAFARLPWSEIFGWLFQLETNPPAYYALMKLWSGVFGASDMGLRLPSALAGAAAVVPMALFCRGAFGPRAAGWGGLLLAISGSHLAFSREARVYPLLFLVFAFGLLFAQRLAVVATAPGKAKWSLSATLGAACALAMALHNTGAIAAASLFVYAGTVLWAERRLSVPASLPFLAAGGVALAIAAPNLVTAAVLARDPSGPTSWIPVPSAAEAVGTFVLVLLMPSSGTRVLLPWLGVPLIALGAAVALWTAWRFHRIERGHPQALGLGAALVFSCAAFFAVSQAVPVLLDRTVLYSLALFLPVLAAGLASLGPGPLRFVAAAAILAPHLAAAESLHRRPGRGEDWVGLAAHLASEAGQTEPRMVFGAFETVALERYSDPRPAAGPLVTVVSNIGGRLQLAAVNAVTTAAPRPADLEPKELCGLLGAAPTLWLVTRWVVSNVALHDTVAKSLLRGGAERVASRDFGRLKLERWTAPRCDDRR